MTAAASLVAGDRALVQIVDAALAEAARRAGPRLACRIGCTECCIGPFAIDALDADRLVRGLAALEVADPQRAAQVRQRARESTARIAAEFPGDPRTGELDREFEGHFAEFANDEPCPALDPVTGACDLYESRPMTCRVFGPPLRTGSQEFALCELCFVGAADAEIVECAVELDTGVLESDLLRQLKPRNTIIAFCLALAP